MSNGGVNGEPLNVIFRRWWEKFQDFNRAREDFRQRLANDELIAMRCDPGKPPRQEKASYWKDARLEPGAEPLTVVVVEPDGSLSQAQFFVEEPTTKPKTPPPEAPTSRGRPMSSEWPRIYGEIAVQLFVKKRKKGKQLTDDIVNCCKAKNINVPNRRDLERAIAALAERVP